MTHVKLDVAKRPVSIARALVLVLIAAAVLCAPRTTRADNCSVDKCITYNATGTFTDGGGLSGAFVLDESNGTIASSTFLADGTSYIRPILHLPISGRHRSRCIQCVFNRRD